VTEFDLRDADAADVPAIMSVMSKAFDPAHGEAWSAQQCACALAIPGTAIVIAERSGQVGGFALFRTLLDETELLLIATNPRNQCSGVGSSLLNRVIARAEAAGAIKIHLEMRANNPALEFYARRGFLNVGSRRDYYRGLDGRVTDAMTMSRMLG